MTLRFVQIGGDDDGRVTTEWAGLGGRRRNTDFARGYLAAVLPDLDDAARAALHSPARPLPRLPRFWRAILTMREAARRIGEELRAAVRHALGQRVPRPALEQLELAGAHRAVDTTPRHEHERGGPLGDRSPPAPAAIPGSRAA